MISSISADSSSSRSESGCVGHAWQTALPGHSDPGLGYCLLCRTTTGWRRSTEVQVPYLLHYCVFIVHYIQFNMLLIRQHDIVLVYYNYTLKLLLCMNTIVFLFYSIYNLISYLSMIRIVILAQVTIHSSTDTRPQTTV